MTVKSRHVVPKEFSELIALVPVTTRAKEKLAATMDAPGRFYHNTGHLAQLWRRHRRHAAAEGFDAPAIERLIACAIAYHDIINDPGRGDNEERSAEAWDEVSGETPLSSEDRVWVAVTIRATKDHLAYLPAIDVEHPPKGNGAALKERARVWVLDLDLSPLGDTEEVFDRNTANLKREAGSTPEAKARAGQMHFLAKLMNAPRIFRIPTMFEIYEEQAQINIRRLMARLGA